MKFQKYFIRYFIFTTVSLSIFIGLFWYLVVLYQFESKKHQELESAILISKDVSKNLLQRINTYESILLITSSVFEKSTVADTDREFYIRLIFNEIMLQNPEFYQLRYINPEGMEEYRVDKKVDDIIFLAKKDLQNKKERYYFKETIKLNVGEIYLSPIDLNVEHGQIEVPWVPTLRMSTPILDKNGGVGVIIINIDLTKDFNSLLNYSKYDSIYLLNKDGYFLAGPDSSALWGFMFGVDNSLNVLNPELWSELKLNVHGEKVQDDYSYAFSSLDIKNYLVDEGSEEFVVNEFVRVLVRIKNISTKFIPDNKIEMAFAFLIFISILIVSYLFSNMVINKRNAEFSVMRSQEALLQSEKMASLGRLVAGIAHELNTPIGSSVTIASTMQDELMVFSKEINSGQIRKSSIARYLESAQSCTEIMMECLQRSSDLVANFKRVSVDQSSELRRKFLLPDYIQEIISTLGPTLKNKNIRILIYANEVIEMDSFPGAFAQVIINLINNSIVHAFPDGNGGNIKISVTKDINNLKMNFRDDGVGILPENIDKIFDPFFTTASKIGGSGLGMHIVYNIVNEVLNGVFSVESEVNKFTEFSVIIPINIDQKVINGESL